MGGDDLNIVLMQKWLAKQWVWNSVGIFAPDILVVDTFPNGSFHELGGIADFGMKKVILSAVVVLASVVAFAADPAAPTTADKAAAAATATADKAATAAGATGRFQRQ